MPLHRRDFMKLVGASLASLLLTRCRSQLPAATPVQTCYEPTAPPQNTATPVVVSARERLRLYWLRFDELIQESREDTENKLGQELTSGHCAELDDLVSNGELSTPVADLVQEAYESAVFHVWRSNTLITCYIMAAPQYTASSADTLVAQSQALSQVAGQGTVDPDTLAKARTAIERDMAFYALTDEEVQALYQQINGTGQYPSFEELSLDLTPEAKEATQFLIDLLTGK